MTVMNIEDVRLSGKTTRDMEQRDVYDAPHPDLQPEPSLPPVGLAVLLLIATWRGMLVVAGLVAAVALALFLGGDLLRN